MLEGLVGSTFDSTTDVVPLKLPRGALCYCANLVKKEDLAPGSLLGPTPLTANHLKGTKWENSTDMYFESRPVSDIYSKCILPQEGTLDDDAWVDNFPKNTTPDAQAWITHVRSAVSNNAHIRTVLQRVKDKGDEKKYISAAYDDALSICGSKWTR